MNVDKRIKEDRAYGGGHGLKPQGEGTMLRFILFVFAMLSFTFLLLQTVHAQDHFKRAEVFLALGRHAILNDDLDPTPSEKSSGYLGFHILYNFTETQSIGVRYGAVSYPTSFSEKENTWVHDLYATYRYSWRKSQPLRIYAGVGLGVSEPIPDYDTGNKFAMSFAVGIKRFVGQHFSLSLESRGVGFTQSKSRWNDDVDVVMAINELTIALGYLF